MSTTPQAIGRIDAGRILMVPLCAYVALHNVFAIHRGFQSPSAPGALDILSQINTLLVTGFYLFMASAYLSRTSPQRSSDSLAVNVAAVGTTFLTVPLLVLFAGDTPGGLTPLLAGTMISIAGLALSLFAIFALGRSFSIIPQARVLVANGPYRYLRHPLYVGEVVAMSGFVIAHLTIGTVVILSILAFLQAFRASREEEILLSTFPDYQDYVEGFRTKECLQSRR